MIGDALVFIRNRLNAHFESGTDSQEPLENQVVFLEGEKTDSLTFKLGAVSMLLINIEEERIQRAADPYTRTAPDGTRQTVLPDIRLNLYVLFVAHYKQYEISLSRLSQVIRYLQAHRVIQHHDAPELNEEIEKLVIELVTLPFSEQNEVWNALRVPYQPSVLYRVKMLVFQHEPEVGAAGITEKRITSSQVTP